MTSEGRGGMPKSYTLVVVVLSVLAVSIAGILYTAHTQRQADHRWCKVLIAIDAPGQPAPTTQRGIEVQQGIHRLRQEFGCKGA